MNHLLRYKLLSWPIAHNHRSSSFCLLNKYQKNISRRLKILLKKNYMQIKPFC